MVRSQPGCRCLLISGSHSVHDLITLLGFRKFQTISDLHCFRRGRKELGSSNSHMVEIPLIEFEHVTIMRGSTPAVRDVSLKIRVGENVAILGPNGCGKSTLVKAISK